MFDASKNWALKCRQKIPNKDLSWSKSEKVYTRLYLNKLESIMRALSDALPTARPPGNGESDASIAFWLRKGHSAGKPLPQSAIREDAKFFVQNWTKKLFWRLNDTTEACIVVQMQWFFKNGQFEGDIIFCHLKMIIWIDWNVGPKQVLRMHLLIY